MSTYGCPTLWQVNGQVPYQEPGCSAWSVPAERTPPDRPPESLAFPAASPSPWTSVGLPWGTVAQPQLMHFTAHSPFASTNALHCKRKSDVENVVPAKQFISEEKMAAHMSGLHISHDYMEHGGTQSVPPYNDTQSEAQMEMNEWLKSGKKIVLADEIKRLQQEPIIPAALLERLEKPCMSLMLWKPKEEIVGPKEEDEDERKTPRNASSVRGHRVGVLVSEICEDNGMDVEM